MRFLFADTAYFVALLHKKDNLHDKATQVSQDHAVGNRLVTTDFVLTELLNLLAKPCRTAAERLVKQLLSDPNTDVVPATRSLFEQVLNTYAQYQDKEWGLVDCASYVVMRQKDINEVLTNDEHFVQMGFRALLREE